jgi:hypothetical protein
MRVLLVHPSALMYSELYLRLEGTSPRCSAPGHQLDRSEDLEDSVRFRALRLPRVLRIMFRHLP